MRYNVVTPPDAFINIILHNETKESNAFKCIEHGDDARKFCLLHLMFLKIAFKTVQSSNFSVNWIFNDVLCIFFSFIFSHIVATKFSETFIGRHRKCH